MHKEWLEVAKTVLDAHPRAGAGIIGVDVFFVTVFVYIRIAVCDVFLKLGCYGVFVIVQCRVCPALMELEELSLVGGS
jgi:hypothetical protein